MKPTKLRVWGPKRLAELKDHLDSINNQIEQPEYIELDPVQFMHLFQRKEDAEIAGFLSAIMAWGRRDIVIAKGSELMERMNFEPYSFVMNYHAGKSDRLDGFRHRTLKPVDLHGIFLTLQHIYRTFPDFEAFWEDCRREGEWRYYQEMSRGQVSNGQESQVQVSHGQVSHGEESRGQDSQEFVRLPQRSAQLTHTDRPSLSSWMMEVFHDRFVGLHPEFRPRTRKHIANAGTGSTCKRLYMYLRWCCREKSPVDPGIWSFLKPFELLIPFDVHVARISRRYGLLSRRTNDLKAVEELTARLRVLDPEDPVRYDYALFALGALNAELPAKFRLNSIDG